MFKEQQPKREFPVERIIGHGFDAEDYEIAKKFMDQRFKDQDFEGLRGVEREKTDEEKEIIGLVNDSTNDLLSSYGVQPVDIPPQNIHILPEEQWVKITGLKDAAACYNFETQGIFYCDANLNSILAYRTFHEMLHIKFHQAAQYFKNKERAGFRSYRSGLGLSSEKREDFETQFTRINEAIVETLAINFWDGTIVKDKRFADEIAKLERVKNVLRKKRENAGMKRSSEEESESRFDELISVVVNGPNDILSFRFSYPDERAALGYLINALYENNTEKFKNPGEVFDLFVRSAMTGHMVELAKLIDKTRGTGAFKRLGEVSSKKHLLSEFIDYVKTF